jgi:hypothetical protein
MVSPIKITPVLHGDSSKRFNSLLRSKQHICVSPEEKSKIFSLVEKTLAKKNKS